ncbi:odorant receptor 47a [Drosophila mojavensis]|uniref:odorant receptor 47a n=1 Tax=Drosophila mojavensis TaxID=7230 RepID=UPI001CD0ABD7|nr:odorant receptor 47a [Drosophila mojavensis]
MKRFRGETLSETQTNLRNILTIYQNSLHMSLTLNRLFRPLINIQFLVASLLLCVLSYQLSENLAQLEVLHYAAFTSSILAQIFLYCHCGEHLKEQSQQCTWQPLKLTMMRAQRGYRIDGHFGDIHVGMFSLQINSCVPSV